MQGLFRVEQIGLFNSVYLDNLVQLLADYDELTAAVEVE